MIERNHLYNESSLLEARYVSMIIVAGHIVTKPGRRDELVAASRDAMIAARAASGCRDFVVTSDPLEPDHVHIYEAWDDETSLAKFRESGPDSGLNTLMERMEVRTYDVSQ